MAVCTLLLGLAFGALVGRTQRAGFAGRVSVVVRTTGSSGTTGGAGASGVAATAPAGTPRLSLADAASVALTGPGSFRVPYPIGHARRCATPCAGISTSW